MAQAEHADPHAERVAAPRRAVNRFPTKVLVLRVIPPTDPGLPPLQSAGHQRRAWSSKSESPATFLATNCCPPLPVTPIFVTAPRKKTHETEHVALSVPTTDQMTVHRTRVAADDGAASLAVTAADEAALPIGHP